MVEIHAACSLGTLKAAATAPAGMNENYTICQITDLT